jgi:hypothetical protein
VSPDESGEGYLVATFEEATEQFAVVKLRNVA